MNFLELVNRTKSECGISGNELTTVVGAVKEMARLTKWVAQSYTDIQLERSDWDFLRKPFTFNTVASQQTYAVGSGLDIDLDDFGSWRNDSFRSYLLSAGVGTEVILQQYYNYSEFRDFYLLGSRRLVTGRPLYITVEPNSRSLMLGFTPNDVYVTSVEYYRTAQELTLDADTPLMPSRFHMAIVYKAMQKYGAFEVANEQIQAGKDGYAMIFNRLTSEYTPIISSSSSMI